MTIWGLKTVAQVIAASGFEGPQHCDEPWPYQFLPGQHVLVHVRGEGCSSEWFPARVISSTRARQLPNATLQYYMIEYIDSGKIIRKEYSPLDGDVKPDCPYVRELIQEELMWPIDDPTRAVSLSKASRVTW